MEKTLLIDGKEIKFKSGASFARIYKTQFGKDILTVIMPVIAEVLQGLDEVMESKEFTPSALGNVLESVYTIELIDIQNIIWSMAKLADKTIPEPELWEEQFNEFPVFDIMKDLLDILIPSLITKKKFQKMMDLVKPKQ